MIFLLAPLDFSGTFAPPNVNDGADPAYAEDAVLLASVGRESVGSTEAGVRAGDTSEIGAVGTSRAGAGALAAPLPCAAGTIGLKVFAAAAGEAETAGRTAACESGVELLPGAASTIAAGDGEATESSMPMSSRSSSLLTGTLSGAELAAAVAGHAGVECGFSSGGGG